METVQVVRPVDPAELDAWYKKNDLSPDRDGIFTSMPYGDAPVHRDVILEQVAQNSLRRDIPNLTPREYTDKVMVYVGGGPTLKHFLAEVRDKCESTKYDVFTSNKTASYLVANGVVPDYHIIVDPTEKKVKDLEYSVPVPLVLGLQCHPALFDRAKEQGRKVFKFLAASITNEDGRTDRDAAKGACWAEDPTLLGIGGGSMCGTRMLFFAAARGYRRLEYYGVDGCIEMHDDTVNCYSYFKPRGENIIETTAANGRTYYSTITLARQGEELVQMLDIIPGLDVEFHGDSLMANQLALYKDARRGIPERITPEYLAIQRAMGEDNAQYGAVAFQHTPRVFMAAAQLCKKLGSCSVLDYGCGQGTLFRSMQEHFPDIPGVVLHEYDPARAGKDTEPKPAELVFCGDVLEHVEPLCVDAVISHISDLTKHLLIVTVATGLAKKELPDGRNAHISVQKKDWWLSKLRQHFVVAELSEDASGFLAVCARFPE